jgi:hypothetical protein
MKSYRAMIEFTDILTWAVILIAFVGGYLIVNFFANRMKTMSPHTRDNGRIKPSESAARDSARYPTESKSFNSDQRPPAGAALVVSEEQKYAQILGVSRPVVASEVKAAYHDLLAKCDVARAGQVGEELHQSANKKTQEIKQAYQYFQRKYGII